jgi:hypothetical protein
VNWQAGSRLRLPEATAEIIASIGEHRILSTAQVRAIHYPDRGLRRTQQALAYLEQADLVAHVERRGSPRRVWFLTEAGADAVILAGDVKERPKVLTPKQAAGPLTAHTLDVNDVGICFMQMAREREEEFGPLGWRHEVAHSLNRGRGRAGRRLIADSVFTYVRHEKRDWVVEQRFLEVDRATLSLERLVAELARYGQLYRARVKGRQEPLWRYSYPVFPPVICALSGASRKALARRRTMALTLLDRHPALSGSAGVAIYVCFLDELRERGPLAPIFRRPGATDQAVNWIGEEKDSEQ